MDEANKHVELLLDTASLLDAASRRIGELSGELAMATAMAAVLRSERDSARTHVSELEDDLALVARERNEARVERDAALSALAQNGGAK